MLYYVLDKKLTGKHDKRNIVPTSYIEIEKRIVTQYFVITAIFIDKKKHVDRIIRGEIRGK